MAASTNEEIIQGVASILTEASSALARLGAAAGGAKSGPDAGNSLAGVAASLAQAAAQIGVAGGLGGGAGGGGGLGDIAQLLAAHAGAGAADGGGGGDNSYQYLEEGAEATMSTTEFCTMHQLEAWVGESLDLLTSPQRAAVMNPPMNVGNARNLNGIVVSRIKQVVPLEQRLGIFVQINGLGEGVIDRLSTLTPEQAEGVMESGLKIQKAANPSGVAMRRISDVLRQSRTGEPEQKGGGKGGFQALPSVPVNRGGGAGLGGGAQQRYDRSRTPPPPSNHSLSSAGDMPEDIQSFVTTLGLEWWCGEVLKRLSLWQRQQITADVQNMENVRSPSGVVMSRVRQFVDVGELMHIFIDINKFDSAVQQDLWTLTPEQQAAVINPGIFLQNVRNPSTAVRSRINNVLAGNDAFGKPLRSDYDGNSAPFKDWRIQENLT